jgi:hypothetical protein
MLQLIIIIAVGIFVARVIGDLYECIKDNIVRNKYEDMNSIVDNAIEDLKHDLKGKK